MTDIITCPHCGEEIEIEWEDKHKDFPTPPSTGFVTTKYTTWIDVTSNSVWFKDGNYWRIDMPTLTSEVLHQYKTLIYQKCNNGEISFSQLLRGLKVNTVAEANEFLESI